MDWNRLSILMACHCTLSRQPTQPLDITVTGFVLASARALSGGGWGEESAFSFPSCLSSLPSASLPSLPCLTSLPSLIQFSCALVWDVLTPLIQFVQDKCPRRVSKTHIWETCPGHVSGKHVQDTRPGHVSKTHVPESSPNKVPNPPPESRTNKAPPA